MISLKQTALAGALASLMFLSGCSTTGTANAGSSASTSTELDRRAAELDAREAALNARAGGDAMPADAVGGGDLLPPNAAPGECYARVWVDAEYTTSTEQVLSSEASNKIRVIPAEYETVTETVEVSSASSRLETIPAVYGTETETIKVRDGQRLWRVALERKSAPASDALLAAAAAHGINLDAAEPGMCFHEHYVPETYSTVTEQVLTKAATEEVVIIPAEYTEVEETVLVREASTRLVTVPAEYWRNYVSSRSASDL